MTVEQQVLLLTRIVRLIEEMQTAQADYIGKDKVVQHLRWATGHLSDDIWQRVVSKDYGTNDVELSATHTH
jgi:hypothetical protein